MKFSGQRLLRAREAANLTQEQLAFRAGTTASTISRLEGDKRPPTLDTIAKLADALGVSLDSLLSPNGDSA